MRCMTKDFCGASLIKRGNDGDIDMAGDCVTVDHRAVKSPQRVWRHDRVMFQRSIEVYLLAMGSRRETWCCEFVVPRMNG